MGLKEVSKAQNLPWSADYPIILDEKEGTTRHTTELHSQTKNNNKQVRMSQIRKQEKRAFWMILCL